MKKLIVLLIAIAGLSYMANAQTYRYVLELSGVSGSGGMYFTNLCDPGTATVIRVESYKVLQINGKDVGPGIPEPWDVSRPSELDILTDEFNLWIELIHGNSSGGCGLGIYQPNNPRSNPISLWVSFQ